MTVLREYINATIGFEELSRVFGKSSKRLMRMFGPKGPLPRRVSVCGDPITCRSRRATPGSQSPEGRLECCVEEFCWKFSVVISSTTEHCIFQGINIYGHLKTRVITGLPRRVYDRVGVGMYLILLLLK
jgi:hypothetical protein